jgi:hypothetical protein
MASLDDLLSAHKNVVQGVNNWGQITSNLAGIKNSGEISTTTLLTPKLGWVANVSVIVAGSTTGTIYDAPNIRQAGTGNRIYIIPTTVGVTSVMLPVDTSIVVTPGTGQIVVVSYS